MSLITVILAIFLAAVMILYFNEKKKNAGLRRLGKYKNLFEGNPAVLLVIDPATGNIVDANSAACSFYGYNRNKLFEMNISQINLLSKEGVLQKTVEISKHNKKFSIEHRLADGTMRHVEVLSGPVKYGEKTFICSVIHDISKRKKAEEKLKLSEAKYSRVFRMSPDAININRLSDGLYYEVNRKFTELTGYTKEEVAGKTSGQINIWADPHARAEMVKQLIRNRRVKNFEASFRLKDGTTQIGLMSARIIKINNEDYILSVTRDIRDFKKAEENIRKLSLSVEQSPAIIVITDINGNIEYVNPKFCSVTGYTPGEVAGKNPRVLKSGHTSREEYASLWSTILSGKEWRGEFLNRKKSGEYYWESAIISPLVNEKGEIVNFIATKEDITEFKKITEELIAAKDAAEEMNRVKSYFFANISHELRTPFVGIIGFSELLIERLEKPEEKMMAEAILTSSKRLTETLNKILNLTKLEFNKMDLVSSEFDVLQVLRSIMLLYSESCRRHNTNIQIICSETVCTWKTDEKIFREIFNNLVSNAVKFTSNGFIDIIIEKACREGNLSLEIHVKDSGVGIPVEKQEIIWHEFRQADEGYNRQFEGTGLGLSIVKRYVTLVGGSVLLKSEPGKGACFTVILPWRADEKSLLNRTQNDQILN